MRAAILGAALLLLASCGSDSGGPAVATGSPSPVASASGVVETAGQPPPSLWSVPVTAKPDPTGKGWKKLSHPTYEYVLEAPASWSVAVPQGFTQERARLLSPPGQPQVRVFVIPWGVYERDVDVEIEKAEAAWLGGDRLQTSELLGEKRFQVAGREAIQHERHVTLQDAEGEWLGLATYIIGRPKAYAVILLCPMGKAKEYRPMYERMVKSFEAKGPEGGHPDVPAPGGSGTPGSPSPTRAPGPSS